MRGTCVSARFDASREAMNLFPFVENKYEMVAFIFPFIFSF